MDPLEKTTEPARRAGSSGDADPGGGPRRLDADGFAAEFRACYGSLRLVASAQAGPGEADDIVQQAAVVGLERLDTFEAGTDFRAWMSAIVRGVARNHRRSGARREKKHRALRVRSPGAGRAGPGVTDGPVPRVVRDSAGIEVALPSGFEGRLRNAVESLGPLQSACLLLRIVHGHSYDEIGVMLEIPSATARSHVHRARAAMLEFMRKEGGSDV